VLPGALLYEETGTALAANFGHREEFVAVREHRLGTRCDIFSSGGGRKPATRSCGSLRIIVRAVRGSSVTGHG